ncbi:MAG TPA: TRAP transporter TatT component family protein, partial [Spirochaetia bacterium]|nr:TRAP transporter TatT component family protein [Spirochaetia bacterium]
RELGGGEERAEAAYRRALEASGGLRASPYVSYASSVCVARQDYKAFKAALEAALAVDVDADPSGRLANIIAQRSAKRLLAQAPDIFLILE